MCGIIGVVRRRATRQPPNLDDLVRTLDGAQAQLSGWSGELGRLHDAATALRYVDTALRGAPGVFALVDDPAGADALAERSGAITALIAGIEQDLDARARPPTGAELEALNAPLLAPRDPACPIR